MANWTKEEEGILTEFYLIEEEEVAEIAKLMKKTEKSIIGKLVYMGIYVPPVKPKHSYQLITKDMLVKQLEELLNVEFEYSPVGFYDLNKKVNLNTIIEAVKKNVVNT